MGPSLPKYDTETGDEQVDSAEKYGVNGEEGGVEYEECESEDDNKGDEGSLVPTCPR